MATHVQGHQTIVPQLEVSVYRKACPDPVVSRLELTQARELLDQLAVKVPDDPIVSAAMRGPDSTRLVLGLQAFHRIVLEREGSIALADVDGALWTIPSSSVAAISVRLVTAVVRSRGAPDPVALNRAFAPRGGGADSH